MISDIPNDEMFLHSEINNNNLIFHDNELSNVNNDYISNELKIDHVLPEEQYLIHHIRLYVKIYIMISSTRVKYQIMLLICYLK